MELQRDARLLRIFTGEDDRIGHDPLYEKILLAAREHGLAGGTIVKGIMSFSAGSPVHRARLIELSETLPVIIDIVDTAEKIEAFLPVVNELFGQCGNGGLVTIENVDMIRYKSKK